MKIIATLVDNSLKAMDILNEVPRDSIILFPESVSLLGRTVKQYSIEKNLFIIYNSDIKENSKRYICMRGVDQGEEIWRVRKFKLWDTDIDDGFSASRAEPIIKIRNKTAALFICFDLTTIGRDGKLFAMGQVIKNYNPEILLLPANWQFNFKLVENVMNTALSNITSLKVAVFSCTNTMAVSMKRDETTIIRIYGWIDVHIE